MHHGDGTSVHVDDDVFWPRHVRIITFDETELDLSLELPRELLVFDGALEQLHTRSCRSASIACTTRRTARWGGKFGPLCLSHLNLSCAQCHDERWGEKLAGIVLPQGDPTGYPLYGLEWQALGSLQRRLRNCMIGMRADPYPYGSPEYIALEAFLSWRARGMAMESPAVRPQGKLARTFD